eukprot:2699197-Amphidinium_carterae.1
MEVQEYTKYYSQYVKVTGGPPSEDEECTIEQMACLHHRLSCNKAPYVDFAVFTPFGDRLQRKIRLSGLALQPDGALKHVEMPGPATLADWEACYRVLRT